MIQRWLIAPIYNDPYHTMRGVAVLQDVTGQHHLNAVNGYGYSTEASPARTTTRLELDSHRQGQLFSVEWRSVDHIQVDIPSHVIPEDDTRSLD